MLYLTLKKSLCKMLSNDIASDEKSDYADKCRDTK